VIEKLTAKAKIADAEVIRFHEMSTPLYLTEDKLKLSGGYRYKNKRKPESYKDIPGADYESLTKPVWMEL